MISLTHAVRVFLHAHPTDLRKGFDALSGLVTTAFSQDPTSGHLFLFVSNSPGRYHFFNQASTTLKLVNFSQFVRTSRSLEARLSGRRLDGGPATRVGLI